MQEKVRNFIAKYRYGIVVCYIPVYFFWFSVLEKRQNVSFTYLHCRIDDLIPFCEYFVIPYLLWFGYIAVSVLFLVAQTRYPNDFFRCAIALMIGMTTFLFLSTIWPNAQSMRPENFVRDNFFTRLVAQLYTTDTSTNVFPSIHVYNSIAIHVALCRCHALRGKGFVRRAVKGVSLILCTLICISTMALKQHSFLDVCGAVVLYTVVYFVVYRPSDLYYRVYRQSRRSRKEWGLNE